MRYNIKGELLNEDSLYFKEHGTYYEAHYSCSTCAYEFSVVSEVKPKGRCPGCPKCKVNTSPPKSTAKHQGRLHTEQQRQENHEGIIKEGFPAIGGKSSAHKAHDDTMQMVMQDYGLTDINDRPHEGENCVPKLPPHLERQVGSGFGGSFGDVPKIAGNINPATISSVGMQQINSGKFRDQGDVVAMQQKFGPKPKYNFINERS